MNLNAYDQYLQQEPQVFGELKALFEVDSVRVVFDIGACEGEDSILYARLFPSSKVFSFEPLLENQELIKYHFQRLNIERCELIPIALSDKSGEAEFNISSGSPEEKPFGKDWNYGNKSSSLLPPQRVGRDWVPWLKFDKTRVVSVSTLDAFCEGRKLSCIDFIHIDVQGAEWLVLQGAVRMLPNIKSIWVEVADAEIYKGQRQRRDIENFLNRKGFRSILQIKNGLESDMLFVNIKYWACFRRWATMSVKGFWISAKRRLKLIFRD